MGSPRAKTTEVPCSFGVGQCLMGEQIISELLSYPWKKQHICEDQGEQKGAGNEKMWKSVLKEMHGSCASYSKETRVNFQLLFPPLSPAVF